MIATCTAHSMRTGSSFVDLYGPDPADISIDDIATALSRQPRFAGNGSGVINVAQHSVHVADDVWPPTPRYRMLALLHDAHEYLIGDIPTPVKRLIVDLVAYRAAIYGIDVVEQISNRLQRAIHKALGIKDPTKDEKERIKESDIAVRNKEVSLLFPGDPISGDLSKYPTEMWDSDMAKREFLSLFHHLKELGAE